MSGNFDFPPASTSPWGPQITRSRSRTAQNRPVAHPREGSSIRQVPSTSLENQRRLLEAHLQETEAELNHRSTRFHASAANTTYVPPSVHRSGTRQAVASLLSSSSQRSRGNRILRGGSQMQEAVNRLNQASSNISAALDPPSPRLRSDATALEDPGGVPVNEVEGDRQRAKRRKLNNGLLAKEFGLNYGYRGQVVPGPLRMEIVFCDGGLHEYGKDKYRPENVLRNDLSVYCTRSSKCDLVLRHEGGAPFCLQRLVVKAPETGFTAPIQEGMVFVAMDLEGLILKASRYTIRQSTSPSPSSFPSPSSSTQSPDLPSNYYLDSTPQGDHEQVRPPSRRRAEDGAHRFIPPPISSNSNDVWHGPASQTRNSSLQDTASSNTRPVQSHFNVSIDCDNHSDDDEEESSEATLADRHHRDRIPSSHYSSDEMDDPDFANYVLSAGTRRLQAPGNRRHRRRTAPRIIGIDELSAAEEGSQAKEGGDVLVPHAAIFIEKEKSMVSVKFEPIV
ncbi:MAG: hypothetical protein LQ343_000273 [Gyalolechia ehrenbergii]|nr:MAG: hypothetical protein LQ343_000273 [Gyalolechia ehrenbergii]